MVTFPMCNRPLPWVLIGANLFYFLVGVLLIAVRGLWAIFAAFYGIGLVIVAVADIFILLYLPDVWNTSLPGFALG
jgi:hypothetical protein